MTFVLNMNRKNHSNAISDSLPGDLGFTIDTVNVATAVYSALFFVFRLSGAVIAKIAGPARCKPHMAYAPLGMFIRDLGIPTLIFSWGLVTLAPGFIKDKAGYLTDYQRFLIYF